VDTEEACRLLGESAGPPENTGDLPGKKPGGGKEALLDFVRDERENLAELRGMLTGERAAGKETLGALVDSLDYLWAHLPGCAGRGGARPPVSDIAFLKMVRAEIDPFLKLWDSLEAGLTRCGS
jgi:hypothetical protein